MIEFGHFSYLVYMLFFSVIPFIIFWSLDYEFLKKNIKVILLIAFLGLLYALVADPISFVLHAWFYNPSKDLGFNFLFRPIEDLLYTFFIAVDLSSLTLLLVHKQIQNKRS